MAEKGQGSAHRRATQNAPERRQRVGEPSSSPPPLRAARLDRYDRLSVYGADQAPKGTTWRRPGSGRPSGRPPPGRSPRRTTSEHLADSRRALSSARGIQKRTDRTTARRLRRGTLPPMILSALRVVTDPHDNNRTVPLPPTLFLLPTSIPLTLHPSRRLLHPHRPTTRKRTSHRALANQRETSSTDAPAGT